MPQATATNPAAIRELDDTGTKGPGDHPRHRKWALGERPTRRSTSLRRRCGRSRCHRGLDDDLVRSVPCLSVELVDALPLSGAGKVLKRELRARYMNPASGREAAIG